jgi:hypothetical protein
LVEALCYKPEGQGLILDEVNGFLNLCNPSIFTMALGLTQALTEMSTRNIPGGKGQSALKANNHSTIYEPVV